MHWIDITVIAIVSLFAIIGLFKGFFDGILSVCSIFVSFLISVKVAPWFANLIRKVVDIDGWFDTFLSETVKVGDSLVIFGASYPREKIATFLTVLLAGIIMFIFIRCLIRLLANLFKSVTQKSATISGINRFLGLILGALKGGLLVVVALVICSIITSLQLPGISDNIASAIGDTKVTAFAYEYVDKAVDQRMDGKSFDEIIHGLFDEEKANEQDENTVLEVVYEEGKSAYTFTVGEDVDYSSILVVYISGGNNSQVVPLSRSNFSEDIDTSAVRSNASVTISAYGKTVTLKYNVVVSI